jgi:hypothetical protein
MIRRKCLACVSLVLGSALALASDKPAEAPARLSLEEGGPPTLVRAGRAMHAGTTGKSSISFDRRGGIIQAGSPSIEMFEVALYLDEQGASKALATFAGQKIRDLIKRDDIHTVVVEGDFPKALRLRMGGREEEPLEAGEWRRLIRGTLAQAAAGPSAADARAAAERAMMEHLRKNMPAGQAANITLQPVTPAEGTPSSAKADPGVKAFMACFDREFWADDVFTIQMPTRDRVRVVFGGRRESITCDPIDDKDLGGNLLRTWIGKDKLSGRKKGLLSEADELLKPLASSAAAQPPYAAVAPAAKVAEPVAAAERETRADELSAAVDSEMNALKEAGFDVGGIKISNMGASIQVGAGDVILGVDGNVSRAALDLSYFDRADIPRLVAYLNAHDIAMTETALHALKGDLASYFVAGYGTLSWSGFPPRTLEYTHHENWKVPGGVQRFEVRRILDASGNLIGMGATGLPPKASDPQLNGLVGLARSHGATLDVEGFRAALFQAKKSKLPTFCYGACPTP